jgi:hypothetical protein
LNERGLEETYEWMKKLLAALVFFFCAVSPSFAAFFDRDNCDDIPSTQRVAFGTFCLQRTTIGGRSEGVSYVWNGSAWQQHAGTGVGVPGGASGDIQTNSGLGTFAGDTDLNFANDVLTLNGALKLTNVISPPQITSNQTDYAPAGFATAAVLRVSTDAPRDLNTLAGGVAGVLKVLYNIGASSLTLKNLGAGTAANQFDINADIVLAQKQGIVIQYDGTSSKWRAASGVSGGGGQASDNDLSALAGLTGTGGAYRIADDTWALRSLTSADVNNLIITNPAGVAGAPTFAVGPNVALTTRSFTATTGDWNFAAASSLAPPNAAGAAPTTLGRIALDTTPSPNRLKYGAGGVTFTIAHTGEVQPLNTALSQIASLAPVANSYIVHNGSTWIVKTRPGCSGAGQSVNYDNATQNEGCVTHTGSISGLTTNFIPKAASSSTLTNSLISETGGAVKIGGALEVGDVSTNFLRPDLALITGEKVWTVQNISGIPLVATTEGGAITDTNIAIFKTTAGVTRIVNGGAAGTGTWTNTSTNTGDNKTLVATGAGGTNTITTPIVVSVDGGGLTASTGSCNDASKVTLDGSAGATQYVMICPTAASAQFDFVLPGLKQAVATFTVDLKVNDVDSSSHHFAGTFKAQCRASGTAPNNTWGSTQTVDITMTTAGNTYVGTTAAITANGTCSENADLYIRFNANGSMTDDGDARIVGMRVKQAS